MSDSRKKFLIVLLVTTLMFWLPFFLMGDSSPERPLPGRDSVAVAVEANQAEYLKTEKPFSEVLKGLEENKISMLAVTPDGELLVRSRAGAQYYVHSPAPPNLLTNTLSKAKDHNVIVVTLRKPAAEARPPSVFSQVTEGLHAIFPLIIILLLLATMRGSVGMLGGKQAFNVAEDPGVRFDDIIGAEDAKQAMGDVVEYLRHPERFAEIGARAPRGLLMEGPPGTGKTYLAKALAGECGVPFISVNGAGFSSPFVGMGVMKVKALFKVAAKHAPCVVFIDEIDGVGNRENTGMGGAADTENSRIINAILTEMDGFDTKDGIVVVGATNHGARLDPALTREGRIDRRCVVGLPNIDERVALFKLYASKIKVADNIDWGRVARLSAGLSPAAIAAVVNAAALRTAQEKRRQVTAEDLSMALERQQMGSPTASVHKAMSEATRRRVAVHEAGHAVVGWKTGMGTLDGVSIVPRSRALGVTLLTQEDDNMLFTATELRARIATFLAGREAEKLVLGEASTGASNDLERASGIAMHMVTETALSGEHGLGGPFSLKALGREAEALTRGKVMTHAIALMNDVEAETRALLQRYRPALDALTAALLERETLTGDEARDAMEKALGQPAASEGRAVPETARALDERLTRLEGLLEQLTKRPPAEGVGSPRVEAVVEDEVPVLTDVVA